MPTMNPPPTLTVDASAIINECEMAEMSPTTPDEMMAPIHMAALLYQGEVGHARHLWRRTLVKSQLLVEWYAVCRAMMVQDHAGARTALQLCQREHAAPLNQYAVEVERAMVSVGQDDRTAGPPARSWLLWSEELVGFLEQRSPTPS